MTVEGVVVSVIITAYNDQATIARAIESVKRQDFSDFEVLVVDDGSVDDTVAVARQALSSGVPGRIIQQENSGLGAARAAGANRSRGRYICFLDADDEYAVNKLRRQVDAYRKTVNAVVFTGAVMKENGRVRNVRSSEGGLKCVTDGFVKGRVKPGGHASMLIDRDLYRRSGGFDPGMRRNCEPDFMLRHIAWGGEVWLLKESLYIVHESLSSNRHSFNHRLASIEKLFERSVGLIRESDSHSKTKLLGRYSQTLSERFALSSLTAPSSYRASLRAIFFRIWKESRALVSPWALVLVNSPFSVSQKTFSLGKRVKRYIRK